MIVKTLKLINGPLDSDEVLTYLIDLHFFERKAC